MSNERMMTAKEYLSQAMYIDQRINSKLDQVMKLRETVTRATATLSDMPHAASPNIRSMEDTIVKIIDLENEINGEIDRLVDFKAEARKVVAQLDSPEQQLVLELRYLCYKEWTEIAECLGFCESNVYKLHGEALKNISVPAKNNF